jgi:ferrous iron transport protein A
LKVTFSNASHLAGIAPGETALVTALDLEPNLAAWLHAVGIGLGERITVLRRAAFGGPIHVRTSVGGEFAIARSLARAIATKP